MTNFLAASAAVGSLESISTIIALCLMCLRTLLPSEYVVPSSERSARKVPTGASNSAVAPPKSSFTCAKKVHPPPAVVMSQYVVSSLPSPSGSSLYAPLTSAGLPSCSALQEIGRVQRFAEHSAVVQSTFALHLKPGAHGAQPPPQSMS